MVAEGVVTGVGAAPAVVDSFVVAPLPCSSVGVDGAVDDVVDGVWMVDVAVAPKNTVQAMRSTKEEIDRYRREGITDAEVNAQKSFFAGNYQVRLGTNAGVASALSFAEKYGFGPKYLDEFPARVRAVTKDQANKVIRERLIPEKLHLVVAGDFDKIPE